MSETTVRGMILAAGYGSRLAPVTDHVPKPLLPVGGRPLLDLIIAAFDRIPVVKIGINTHHLGSMVADHIQARADRDRFTLFPEEVILGTGGALDGAREFLARADHFLLHNGDVLCEADLPDLVADHLESGALATLLLVHWPAVNSVAMDSDGRISSIAGRPPVGAPLGSRNLTYAGIGVYSRKLLDDIEPGFSSLIDPLVRALKKNPDNVRGHAPEGVSWSDLGTLKRWLEAQPQTTACGRVQGLNLARITGHGSDRKFWRLSVDEWSAVAMVSPAEDEEFDRFIDIAGFLARHDLGSADLLSVSGPEHAVLMEDLGATSLLSLVHQEGPETERVQDAYRRTLDQLLVLQAATATARQQCPAAVDRRLDYDAFRWETNYFRDRFLAGHLRLATAQLEPLDDEFHRLATVVAAQPQTLIHRDFQSQNIHLKDGRIRLVDFQGMRLGPLTYDLMSLLMDPYVVLPGEFRAALLDRFVNAAIAAGSAASFEAAEIRAMALASGLQRIMQALGAFGFLGHVKGRKSFLDHIPAGLAVLREILAATQEAAGGEWGDAGRWLPDPMPQLEELLRTPQ